MLVRPVRTITIVRLILVAALVVAALTVLGKYVTSHQYVFCRKTKDKYGQHLRIDDRPQDRIPHRLHQIFRDAMIPKPYHEHVRSWRRVNPSWEYFFWTDADADAMIKDKYPKYYDLYKSYNHPLQRSDAIRYFILHQYGGVYSDLDVQALKPLDEFLKTKTCVISPEPTVQTNLIFNLDTSLTNCIMAGAARHPFLEFILDSLKDNYRLTAHNWDVLHSTGPFFLNKTYNAYLEKNPTCRSGAACSVFVADHRNLVPTIDVPDLKDNFARICVDPKRGTRQMKACKELEASHFKNVIPKEAYTNHLWLHLGWASGKKYRVEHICDLVPDAISYSMIRDLTKR